MNIQLLFDVLGGSVSSYLLSKSPHRLKWRELKTVCVQLVKVLPPSDPKLVKTCLRDVFRNRNFKCVYLC